VDAIEPDLNTAAAEVVDVGGFMGLPYPLDPLDSPPAL
jgi:hypothetical protein